MKVGKGAYWYETAGQLFRKPCFVEDVDESSEMATIRILDNGCDVEEMRVFFPCLKPMTDKERQKFYVELKSFADLFQSPVV